MAVFHYKALNREGNIVEEKIEAPTELEAITEIDRRGYQLIEIKTVNPIISLLSRKKVKKNELANFSKQLSYLISTGIPMDRGIAVIGEQMRNSYFKSVLTNIVQDIKEGLPLSQACSKHTKVFPETMIFQIQAAETGGFMQETLMNISKNLERDYKFSKQIKSAMTYPIVVLSIALIIVYIMLAIVVPKIAQTLLSFNTELPLITQTVVFLSDFVKKYWYVFLLAIVLSIYVFRTLVLQSEERKLKFHKHVLKLPLFGRLWIQIDIARMAMVLSSMVSSGVQLVKALDIVKRVLGNKYLSQQLEYARRDIQEKGYSMSQALEERQIFPRILVQIIQVGEESGNIETTLSNYSEQLEEEISATLKNMTNLINPILMIIIGGIVGVIIVSLFMPMFKLIDNL